MADTQPATTPAAAPKARKKRSETADTLVFLLKLAALVFVIRSFIFSPFSIPSESMLPRLYIGDYLFVSKWNYGYRSEERRVGKEGVSTCRYRGWRDH